MRFSLVWSAVSAVSLWLAYGWATSAWPSLSRRRAIVIACFAILWSMPTALHLMTHFWHGLALPSMLMSLVVIAITMAGPWLGILRLASLMGRRLGPASVRRRDDRSWTRRQALEATSGTMLLGTSGTILGWGFARGRHEFEITEVAVRIRGLPRTLDGYVIGQISDIHAGAFVGESELAEGLARVREARPDIVVVTGDLVDFDARFAPWVARRLTELNARDGVVAALGNHDYYAGRDEVIAALEAAGVPVLVDRGRVIRAADGGGFALLGVDDLASAHRGGHGPRIDIALSTVPPSLPRILLSHQPHTVDRWAGRIALQLSGHTHGGQINPGFRLADLIFPYVAGRYEVGGTSLYVNRGFGTSGPPSRVGAPPEITRIVLVAA